MGINKQINKFIASIMLENYAGADAALKKIVNEKLKKRFDSQYRTVERSFFGK